MARAMEIGMVPSAKYRLLTSACQKTGSCDHQLVVLEADEDRRPLPLGVEKKLCHAVATAG